MFYASAPPLVKDSEGQLTDRLVVLASDDSTLLQKSFVLQSSPTRVGRNDENDVAIDSPEVSRNHAQFELTGKQWRVSDAGSLNGTYWNHSKVSGRQALRNGDRIRMGSTIFKYVAGTDVESTYHEELNRLAFNDDLTGIANQRSLREALTNELVVTRTQGCLLAVLMFGIDNFKRVNELHSETAGNFVLQELVRMVELRIDGVQVFARMGSDEFCIVLPMMGLEEARKWGEELRRDIEDHVIVFQQAEIRVTISAGCAVSDGGSTPDGMLSRARRQLDNAKREGRNRVIARATWLPNNPEARRAALERVLPQERFRAQLNRALAPFTKVDINATLCLNGPRGLIAARIENRASLLAGRPQFLNDLDQLTRLALCGFAGSDDLIGEFAEGMFVVALHSSHENAGVQLQNEFDRLMTEQHPDKGAALTISALKLDRELDADANIAAVAGGLDLSVVTDGLVDSPPTELQRHLWEAAAILRGSIDAGDFKHYIFGLLFFKRICDVWQEEYEAALDEYDGDEEEARSPDEHRFQLPKGCSWSDIRKKSKDIGAALNHAFRDIEDANPRLFGVFQDVDFANKERFPDASIDALLAHFDKHRLRNADVAADVLGNAYEYLIAKFADDAGKTADEFYTPQKVVELMVTCLEPEEGMEICDPTCGSGGMLLACRHHMERAGKDARTLVLYGQEKNLNTWAICKMNLFLHDIDVQRDQIARGDTLTSPMHLDGDRTLKKFDLVLANPPFSLKMWGFEAWKDGDAYGRDAFGCPPQSSGDLAFLQHMVASLKVGGRMAMICPAGVLFRGGSEEVIRRRLLEENLVEAVIQLAPGLMYGTGIPVCIWILRGVSLASARARHVLFIEASEEYSKEGRQRNLTDENVERILRAYRSVEPEEDFTAVVSVDTLLAEDANLSPRKYVNRELDTYTAKISQWGDERSLLSSVADITLAPRVATGNDVPCVYLGRTNRTATLKKPDAPPHKAANWIAIRPRSKDKLWPDYLQAYLNSPVGQLGLKALAGGVATRQVNTKELKELVVPVPSLAAQEAFVECTEKIVEFESTLQVLRRRLPESPKGLASVQNDLKDYSYTKSLDFWFGELSFPLASVLRRYRRVASVREKGDNLLFFFEALAQFVAMVDLSCFQQAANVGENVPTLGGLATDIKVSRLRNPGIGVWAFLHRKVTEATQHATFKDEVRPAFHVAADRWLDEFCKPEIVNLLQRVADYKNEWKSHNAAANEKLYVERLQTLEKELSKTHRLLSKPLAEMKLIRAKKKSSHCEGNVHVQTVYELKGSEVSFNELEEVRTRTSLDVQKMYIIYANDPNPLELVPLIIMAPVPDEERDACYLYSSSKRWVSYHYEGQPEASPDDPGVAWAGRALQEALKRLFPES